MKIFFLFAALFFSVSFYCFDNSSNPPTTVVVHIDEMNNDELMAIYNLFKEDANYEVINSCQLLDIIVIRTEADVNSSKIEAQAYIQQKISTLTIQKTTDFVENKSSNDVSLDCRAKVAELYQDK